MADDDHRAKRVAGKAVFQDSRGCVLLVKPTYLNHWQLPGGRAEFLESPREACQRELCEELGVSSCINLRLTCVQHRREQCNGADELVFIFDAGILQSVDIDMISL